MKNLNISILSTLLIKLVVAIVFLWVGTHLIRYNEIVTKNLLKNAGIFEKKETSNETKQIDPKKLKFNKIMIYIVGVIFTIGGFLTFLSLFHEIKQIW